MSSAIDRLKAFHIARLQDKNPQVRIKSIEELQLLEATDVIDTLEELFRSDPDTEVRKAAQNAGRSLFLLKKKQEANGEEA